MGFSEFKRGVRGRSFPRAVSVCVCVCDVLVSGDTTREVALPDKVHPGDAVDHMIGACTSSQRIQDAPPLEPIKPGSQAEKYNHTRYLFLTPKPIVC